MAGDWIKMRVDLGDDPAVIQIAASLDISEDEVVGKLHRLWAWADRHTTDGTAPAITAKWVDRYVSMSGFAEAMVGAGWISFSDAGVAFPGFERHNGESAKRRVEATLRQRLSRKNRDDGVTGDARTPIPRPFVRHVMARDNYICVYCGVQSSAEREAGKRKLLSVDHIKPIARGGSAAVENLACCCKQCNSEKADRTPEEWGLLPGFLQAGVEYQDGLLVSQKNCDSAVIREEKRREEKKDQEHCVPSAHGPAAGIDLFDRFWKLYPRKQDKAKAAKAFAKLRVTDDLFNLIAKGLAAQAASHDWIKDNGKYVPMPTTWLNGRRWEDEVKPSANVHAFPGQSRHTGFAERDYEAGLIPREDGTNGF